MTLATSPFASVEGDLRLLAADIKSLVSDHAQRHPVLVAAAEYLFGTGGKRIRPAIVFLVSRATLQTRELTPRHRRLAEITEMIHTASLVHDDVLDESEVRRGVPTVHSRYSNQVAVLAGDFLFAQSSWYLANLDNLDVVKLLSLVIKDLAQGEIQQGLNRFDTNFEAYLEKSYCKTASLIANSAKAAAILSGVSATLAEEMYHYGRHLGLAFQLVDDILDFTGSTELLGKPAGSDMKSGNLTAPVLFALEEQPYLESLIKREFAQDGDLDNALSMVLESNGIQRSRELAAQHSKAAIDCLTASLSASEARQALMDMAEYTISRLH
jgi:all-trans-nonaprenyl-diphosphate synthase